MAQQSDFNSHTREGVTSSSVPPLYFFNFNSHTREGVTAIKRQATIDGNNFNSHTREGVTYRGQLCFLSR